MDGTSLIPDSLKATFSDLLKTYTDIEAIKLQRRLTDAQIGLASMNLPSNMMDAQAKAQSQYIQPQPMSTGTKVLIGAGALLALYLIVK